MFAKRASRGRWRPAAHLNKIDKALTDAVKGFGPNRIVITLPPRHGKSMLTSQYFPAWFIGTYPDRQVMLCSYEAEFAKQWGRKCRDTLEQFGPWFRCSVDRRTSAASQWTIKGRYGGMVTSGVGGGQTGRGADLLIVDDPVKNAADADSVTYRDKAWEWWQSTALSRLEPGGVAVVIQTRWHLDDLAGRILTNTDDPDQWLHLDLPAISEEGKALWPERWPLETLLKIKQRLISSGGLRWWEALYQQRPNPPKGEMFDVTHFQFLDAGDLPALLFSHGEAMRYWDLAATQGDGDYTAGGLMVALDGILYIVDMKRGQWSTRKRDEVILATCKRDAMRFANYRVVFEQEPGSSGVDAMNAMYKMLQGFHVAGDRVTGQKAVRAGGYSTSVDAGFVYVVKAAWNGAFICNAMKEIA